MGEKKRGGGEGEKIYIWEKLHCFKGTFLGPNPFQSQSQGCKTSVMKRAEKGLTDVVVMK